MRKVQPPDDPAVHQRRKGSSKIGVQEIEPPREDDDVACLLAMAKAAPDGAIGELGADSSRQASPQEDTTLYSANSDEDPGTVSLSLQEFQNLQQRIIELSTENRIITEKYVQMASKETVPSTLAVAGGFLKGLSSKWGGGDKIGALLRPPAPSPSENTDQMDRVQELEGQISRLAAELDECRRTQASTNLTPRHLLYSGANCASERPAGSPLALIQDDPGVPSTVSLGPLSSDEVTHSGMSPCAEHLLPVLSPSFLSTRVPSKRSHSWPFFLPSNSSVVTLSNDLQPIGGNMLREDGCTLSSTFAGPHARMPAQLDGSADLPRIVVGGGSAKSLVEAATETDTNYSEDANLAHDDLQKCNEVIEGQRQQISQLEEIVNRRTKQVEQLTLRLTDFRVELNQGDTGQLTKRVAQLERQLDSSRKHEVDLEAELSATENKLQLLYVLQCHLSDARAKFRALRQRLETTQETLELTRTNHMRCSAVLAAMDAEACIMGKQSFRPQRPSPHEVVGTQTQPTVFRGTSELSSSLLGELQFDPLAVPKPQFWSSSVTPRTLEDDSAVSETGGKNSLLCLPASPAAQSTMADPLKAFRGWRQERRSLLIMLQRERKMRQQAERQVAEYLSFRLDQQGTPVRDLSPLRISKNDARVMFGSSTVYDFSKSRPPTVP